GMLHAAETAAPSGVKVIPLGVHNTGEIEQAVTAFATEPNSGLIAAPHAVTFANRDVIVELASRFRLRRGLGLLRDQSDRDVAAGGVVCRSRPQGRKARRLAGAISYEIRTGRQPEDCQGSRPCRPSSIPRPRRRS